MMTDASVGTQSDLPAIHWIKAIAIIAVIFNHSGPTTWSPKYGELDVVLRQVWVSFHVPAFIFVSGFLYYRREPIRLPEILRRCGRIGVPYLVASLVLLFTGVARLPPHRTVLTALATGSTIGIYYYVFVVTIFVLVLLWPLSRLPRSAGALLLCMLVGYFAIGLFRPWVLAPHDWFWAVRNPLFYAHYFLAGWLVRGSVPLLLRLYEKYRWIFWTVALTIIGSYLIVAMEPMARGEKLLARSAYSLSVIGVIAALTYERSVPALVRWVSNATYPIFLYHFAAIVLLLRYTLPLPTVIRTLSLVAAALAFGVVVTVIGRRLLGTRAALIMGG